MPSTKNQNQLTGLQAALKDSKAVIITNYQGLSMSDQSELKKALKSTGSRFTVAKNTIIRLALKERLQDLPEEVLQALQGQNAVILSNDSDPVSPTKALYKFIKNHELPTVRLGVLDNTLLSASEVENLSKLPGRDELLGQLAGQLNAPISSFAQVLRANLQNIVFVVDAIKRSKQSAS